MPSASDPRRSGSAPRAGLSVVLCLVILLLGGVGFLVLASLRQPPELREPAAKVYNVTVFPVQPAELQQIISGFGTARADREVLLAAQVAGQIVEAHPRLRVGQRVEAASVGMSPAGESRRSEGDLLVRIDPQTYQERLSQAETQLAADQAELARLKQEEANTRQLLDRWLADYSDYQKELQKTQELHRKGVATESDLRRVQLELRQYEKSIVQSRNELSLFPLRRDQLMKRIDAHRADLKLARLELERSEIRPPFDARLSEVLVEKGQYLRPGDAIARLTDDSLVEVAVPITLDDYARLLPRIQAGDYPTAMLAENETAPPRWYGEVVRAAPKADEQTRTVNVFVQVENAAQDSPLLPGTFVHARIDGPVFQEAVAVPRDSLINGRVFVARDGHAEPRAVTVGRTLQTLALLTGGLQAGDQVILTNLDVIHDGAQVHVQDERTLAQELDQQRIKVARQLAAKPAGQRQPVQ